MILIEMLVWIALGALCGAFERFGWPQSAGGHPTMTAAIAALAGGAVARAALQQNPTQFSVDSLVFAGFCAIAALAIQASIRRRRLAAH